MLNEILFAIWFFMPAGAANSAPIIAAKTPVLKKWNTPMDFGKSYKDKRIFGNNKTWRGIVSATLVGGVFFALQQAVGTGIESFDAYLDEFGYFELPLVLGFLLGFGAILGDAAKSFLKRRHSVPSGESWFPFDQLDYIIGGCLFAAFVVMLPFNAYVWIFMVWFVLHLAFSFLGYKLHLKDKPV